MAGSPANDLSGFDAVRVDRALGARDVRPPRHDPRIGPDGILADYPGAYPAGHNRSMCGGVLHRRVVRMVARHAPLDVALARDHRRAVWAGTGIEVFCPRADTNHG